MLRSHEQIVDITLCDSDLIQEFQFQETLEQVVLAAVSKAIDEREKAQT